MTSMIPTEVAGAALREAGREVESARRWAVTLEQENAFLREQIAAALAVAEQLGCTCEFIPDGEPCDYCTLREFLTLPHDPLVLDVIEQRRREEAAGETAALQAEGEAELAESGADYAEDFYREVAGAEQQQ